MSHSNTLFHLRLRNDQCIAFSRPAIMGIINMSPHSFYRPHLSLDRALQTAEEMIDAGADILDIGGFATNPLVDLIVERPLMQMEMDQVIPVILAIKQRFDILISVDTSLPGVMHEAASVGADILNDQCALQSEDALQMAAKLKMPVCLMHGFAQNRNPGATDLPTLIATVKQELTEAVLRCKQAGIVRDRIIIDPGFGQGNFRKNKAENYYLLTHLSEIAQIGYPVLSGWSRKSMIGDTLGLPVEKRLFGSIAADTIAAIQGASIIRTHDVAASREAVMVAVEAFRTIEAF